MTKSATEGFKDLGLSVRCVEQESFLEMDVLAETRVQQPFSTVERSWDESPFFARLSSGSVRSNRQEKGEWEALWASGE